MSAFVDVDDFSAVGHQALMRTVCRSLEAAGLGVVAERGGADGRPPARSPRQTALVLVEGQTSGWQGAGAVMFRQVRGPGAPVVVVGMFDDEDAARSVMAAGGRGERAYANALTGREVEVLQALANGFSTTDVARSLYISHKTVKNHLAHIYTKLGASSRTQAVANGVRSGIVRIA